MIDLSSIACLPSTRVVRIEHHNDGTTTLLMERPNVSTSVPTDELYDIDRVLWRLRQNHNDRHQISGKFMLETSRKLRNQRWSEMLNKADMVDHRLRVPSHSRSRSRKKDTARAD